nr:unnamed protein product [Digitaria exilis]
MAVGEDGSSAEAAAAMPLLAAAVVEKGRTTKQQRRHREGCPGCRLEEANKASVGVPYLNFFYIWVVCLTAVVFL